MTFTLQPFHPCTCKTYMHISYTDFLRIICVTSVCEIVALAIPLKLIWESRNGHQGYYIMVVERWNAKTIQCLSIICPPILTCHRHLRLLLVFQLGLTIRFDEMSTSQPLQQSVLSNNLIVISFFISLCSATCTYWSLV